MATFTIAATEWRTTYFGFLAGANTEKLVNGAHTVTVTAGGLLEVGTNVTDVSGTYASNFIAGITGLGAELGNAVWTLAVNGSVYATDGTATGTILGAGLFNGFGTTSNKLTVGADGTLYGDTYGFGSSARGTVTNNGVIYGDEAGIIFGANTSFGSQGLVAVYGAGSTGTNLDKTAAVTVTNAANAEIGSKVTSNNVYTGSGILSTENAGLTVTNSGKITGGSDLQATALDLATTFSTYDFGIFSKGALTLTNNATGVITGNVSAAWIGSKVTNSGIINGVIETKIATDSGNLVDVDLDGDYNDTLAGGAKDITTLTGLTLTNSGFLSGSTNSMFLDVGELAARYTVIGSGAKDVLTNSGYISRAVHTLGGDDKFTNSGFVSDDGIKPATLKLLTDVFFESVRNGSNSNGDALVSMGEGNDTLTNTGTIAGYVSMGAGNDVMTGGAGIDRVLEHAGSDKYTLGDGFDLMYVIDHDLFKDTMDGGKGTDLILLSNEGLSIDLTAKTLKLIGDNDTIGAHTDSVIGFEQVVGGSGNDSITGGTGAESLAGGLGDDTITGLVGKDVIYGGGGTDVFVFKTAADSTVARAGRDMIMDFTAGDKIQLTFDANTATKTVVDAFDLELNPIQYGNFTKDEATAKYVAGQLRYHYEAGNTILRGDTNGDGIADFAIEVKGHYAFTAGDFLQL